MVWYSVTANDEAPYQLQPVPLSALMWHAVLQEMLDCWQGAGSAAPINVAFVFEGEEENGSTGFQEALSSNVGWFEDAHLVIISNTVWVGENVPCLTYGMRGMITASLQVRAILHGSSC